MAKSLPSFLISSLDFSHLGEISSLYLLKIRDFWELKAFSRSCFSRRLPFSAISLFLSFILPWLDLIKESKWIYMLVQRVPLLPAACALISLGSSDVLCLELVPSHMLEPSSRSEYVDILLPSWLLFFQQGAEAFTASYF